MSISTKIKRIENRIADEPIVPKSKPPFESGLVNKSPKVAPKGRVKTNATQNKIMCEILVK